VIVKLLGDAERVKDGDVVPSSALRRLAPFILPQPSHKLKPAEQV
jgi:hypothetical protein